MRNEPLLAEELKLFDLNGNQGSVLIRLGTPNNAMCFFKNSSNEAVVGLRKNFASV